VRRGDNLTSISKKFGIAVADLKRANRISNPNQIHPGQTLLVSQGTGKPPAKVTPTSTPPSPPQVAAASKPPVVSQTYTVRRGDNLTSISKKFRVAIIDLKRANGISNPNRIYPGMKLKIPGTDSPTHYVVRRGDTLAMIAQKFGSSINDIQNANGIRNPHEIQRGQELLIP